MSDVKAMSPHGNLAFIVFLILILLILGIWGGIC
jgi:hypothetical protein